MNADGLIDAVFGAAGKYSDGRYAREQMITDMLEIIKKSTDVNCTHEKTIRELALEMTDLVEPE